MTHLRIPMIRCLRRTFQQKYIRPSLARLLILTFITNSAFAYKPEQNFWADRQMNQLASLPAPVNPLFYPNTSPSFDRPTSALKAASSISRPSHDLPVSILKYVNIREAYRGKDTHQIILLEDVHQNNEAQTNIAESLRTLEKGFNHENLSIGLEGAYGPSLYGVYTALENKEKAKKVADEFFQSGKISGPAHFGFTTYPDKDSASLNFFGLEDPILYHKNISAYQTSSQLKTDRLKKLNQFENENQREKQRTLNPSLRSFDQVAMSYRSGERTLGDYLKHLTSFGIETKLNIDIFLQAFEIEYRIDFSEVEKERAYVFHSLVDKAPQTDLNELVRLGMAYQEGHVSNGKYYSQLKKICSQNGINLNSTPSFQSYIQYVLLADGIKPDKLFEDVESAEQSVYRSLIQTEREQFLIQAGHQIQLAKKLVDYSLTSMEWESYADHQELLPIDVSPFEAFYEAADARSEKMVEKLLNTCEVRGAKCVETDGPRTTNHAPRTVVAVIGGFHTQKLTQLLKEQGRSYIVASPKITKIDSDTGSHYLSVFDREKNVLEKIFSGEKLFLSPPRAGFQSGRRVSADMSEAYASGSDVSPLDQKRLSLLGWPGNFNLSRWFRVALGGTAIYLFLSSFFDHSYVIPGSMMLSGLYVFVEAHKGKKGQYYVSSLSKISFHPELLNGLINSNESVDPDISKEIVTRAYYILREHFLNENLLVFEALGVEAVEVVKDGDFQVGLVLLKDSQVMGILDFDFHGNPLKILLHSAHEDPLLSIRILRLGASLAEILKIMRLERGSFNSITSIRQTYAPPSTDQFGPWEDGTDPPIAGLRWPWLPILFVLGVAGLWAVDSARLSTSELHLSLQ